MKKSVVILLSVMSLFILSLTGCENKNNASSTAPAPTQNAQTTTPAA